MTTTNNYVGLSHREIQALGGLSGECFRLYVAVASFAYGKKTVCFPTWAMLSDRMGKPLDKSNGRTLARKLEEAGLIKRGEFGRPDRWRLVLKEQIIKEQGGNSHPQRGSDLPPSEGENDHPTGLNSPPVNNKNKKTNEDFSLLENREGNSEVDRSHRPQEEWTQEDWEKEGFILLSEGYRDLTAIATALDRRKQAIFNWSQSDRRKILQRLVMEGLDPLVREINQVIYPNRVR